MKQLPFRFLLIDQGGYQGVLKVSYILNSNQLLILFELYDLKEKLITSLLNSFNVNPLCQSVFNNLGITLRKRNFFGLGVAEDLLIQLDEAKCNKKYTEIVFPDFRLYLCLKNIYRLHSFIYQYLYSYDILDNIYKQQPELKLEQVKTNQTNTDIQVYNENIIDDNADNINSKSKTNQTDTGIITETDIGKLLHDILSLAPSNITRYFVIKNIIIGNNCSYKENPISINNNNLVISTYPLLRTNMLTPKIISSDINHIINSIICEREELTDLVKQCLLQICYISKLNNLNDNHFILIQILQFIIMIYILYREQPFVLNKYNSEGIYNIGKFINSISNLAIGYMLKENKNLTPYNSIIFNGASEINFHDAEYQVDVAKINEAIEKYKYQLSIDKQTYLDHVSTFVNNSDIVDNSNCQLKDIITKDDFYKYNIKESCILNINQLLLDNTFDDSLLAYKLNNGFITNDCYHTFRLSESGQLSNENSNILKELDPIISLNATRINTILSQLTSISKVIDPLSTLHILHKYILPAFYKSSEIISFDILLFILYRICVPYLYKTHNINGFIDYFHGQPLGIDCAIDTKLNNYKQFR